VETRELIRGLAQKHSVLLSTHILAEAEQVCDRVLIVNRGKIVGDSTLHRSSQGERAIFLRLRQPRPDTLTRLAAVPGIVSVGGVEGPEGGYKLICAAESAPESDIARAAVEHDWGLVELGSAHTELETMFLQTIARSRE
jgi:ABC-2 type transport system ATP-binding protein